MSNIVINELFYELKITEQKAHIGGKLPYPFGKPAIQKLPRIPMYTYRFVQDQEALANFLETATQADIFGW